MRSPSPLPEVVAVFGPTASGKSGVAEALATGLDTEVVSADALQVYRRLPILTNQPDRPTRLVAIRNLSDEMSVGEYAGLAHAAIDELVATRGSAVVAGGVTPGRMGNAHPSLYPYEPFPTADRDLVLAVGNDGQFARLCEVLGMPQLAEDPRYATMGARNAHRDDLLGILSERLRTRGADESFELLRAVANGDEKFER